MADEFARALRLMRRRDPQLAEDGFQRLRAVAGQHVDRLVDEFRHEPDHGLRCWLLELIGHARSPRAFELLVGQLSSDDESLRKCAERGLRLLDTKEARTALFEHGR
ncbi:HEAT repeat domain-containing protein [Asanoa sp. WMMD1127]|uniref:HEAT repeat domain-containing protein n=1 Tax=Asanoa sp. WMMD1127 TaxID=3016107 RepID=UPI002415A2A2|nr:HEAT repeat domain-containing protein [Asanoa sp. WMMD1127]MDG4827221.1 HEAT repeat domain-containing protein [Asanoa sp. WMMD1127]